MKSFRDQLAEIMALDMLSFIDVSKRTGLSTATLYQFLKLNKEPGYQSLARLARGLQLQIILVRPDRPPLRTLKYRPPRRAKPTVPRAERPKAIKNKADTINFSELGL